MNDVVKLTSQSPGAPVLTGQAGMLVGVLSWALPQLGWDVVYMGTNAALYRSGNIQAPQMLLYVLHNTAIESGCAALVRGCESATDINTRTNEFPTTVQMASPRWHASSTANSTPRAWKVIGDDRLFYFGSEVVSGRWLWQVCGGYLPYETNTAYSWMLSCCGTSGSVGAAISPLGTYSAADAYRDYYASRGTNKAAFSSTRLMLATNSRAGTTVGDGVVAYPSPVHAGLDHDAVYLSGAVSPYYLYGRLPGLLAPLANLAGASPPAVSYDGKTYTVHSITGYANGGALNGLFLQEAGAWR